ncbi:VCBS repeat-containing protein [Streptomyces sp. NBC_00340]|uniref:FG-GAP repeat domain-containing protein n=1 Tax=Streptomyces sp. NBC_00340 TaxID=2975716 RepID=UPI002250C057|nr:VCBS repeat-containing protein [Streptomyces sp. NBC_00340]MCX5131873.1 VCBS repeat-containing protein [Streptomyces sp. NBC_00340]
MGSHAFRRGRLVTAVAVAALAIGGVTAYPLITAAPSSAATLAPWGTATPITGTQVSASVKDLVTAADGSAVAVWNQFAGRNSNERKLYAAVRPAGSDTWGTPALLATTPTEGGSVKLHASADGTVTALWVEFPNETSPGAGELNVRLVSSVLPADRSAWSAPVELVGTHAAWTDGGIDLAEASDGSLTAVWGTRATANSKLEVSTATRGSDSTWSEPKQISTAVADGANMAAEPSVAVAADGTTVVVYEQRAGETASLRAVTRAAGATAWTAPSAVAGTYQSVSQPELAAADDGSLTLAWEGHTDESEPETIYTATRAVSGGTWSAAQAVANTDDLVDTPEPLIAPNGEVTLVWVDYTTTFGTRTATRATNGTWSAVRTLSTGYVPEQYDVAIGGDGTVHALWIQMGGGGRVLMESVRSDGEWTSATQLPGSANAYVRGQVSVGGDGGATAVWSGATTSSSVDRLYGSRTAWPALAVSGSNAPATADLRGTTASSNAWAPVWQLSRPTSSWSLTLTDTAGRTVRTLTGTAAGLKAAASWNGRTSSGGYAPNGPLTWTLRATQVGATTAAKLASGTVAVSGGAAVARDFGGTSAAPDGTGDLLTLNSSGALTYQLGKRTTGTFSGKVSGTGWATSVKAVPIGDLSGDRCNDVLVRLSSGSLRLYKPGCGKAVIPTTSYTSLGTGWDQYDVLTSPGDMSGDGRPDLIARSSSTGAVYLYKGTSSGTLSARVKLSADWSGYKKVVGVGDLNGDGIGDLLAQTSSNDLYRYNGTGTGTFKTRVKVFSAWGGSYNAVVGVGDITGDGKVDLVSRDSAGNVYRNNGDGKGSFGSRTQIATGWSGYKSLS